MQGNAGMQSDAIREATDSIFTHCGVVFQDQGKWMVMEATQPVKVTPLETFMRRSRLGTYKAYRLKEPLDQAGITKAKEWAKGQIGKPYDLHFRWEDRRLYCSEFVWKLYDKAGIELCDKRPFKDYNLNGPTVSRVIKQRYGGHDKLPMDELAVAPGDIANSDLLVEVPKLK